MRAGNVDQVVSHDYDELKDDETGKDGDHTRSSADENSVGYSAAIWVGSSCLQLAFFYFKQQADVDVGDLKRSCLENAQEEQGQEALGHSPG
jgi:hypothetical protein